MPGRISRMWFELTTPGKFEIACAEMCGTYHYRMKSDLTVYNQEDFDHWYSAAKELALQENDEENAEEFWGWPWATRKVGNATAMNQ